MGAEFVIYQQEGERTLKDAFAEAHERALYLYGHRSYTGSLAEKSEAILVGTRNSIEDAVDAARLFEDSGWRNDVTNPFPQYSGDKWGPAAAIEVIGEGGRGAGWVIFGWCPS